MTRIACRIWLLFALISSSEPEVANDPGKPQAFSFSPSSYCPALGQGTWLKVHSLATLIWPPQSADPKVELVATGATGLKPLAADKVSPELAAIRKYSKFFNPVDTRIAVSALIRKEGVR